MLSYDLRMPQWGWLRLLLRFGLASSTPQLRIGSGITEALTNIEPTKSTEYCVEDAMRSGPMWIWIDVEWI